jgi:hypothetical protein
MKLDTRKHPDEFGEHGLMPFAEIGRRLGMRRQNVWALYKSGMRKMRGRMRLVMRGCDVRTH